jgi:DNA polymerase
VTKELDRLDKELAQITRHAVTSATQLFALKDWLQTKGHTFESLSKNVIAEKIEAMDDTSDPDVRRVLEIRRDAGKSSVAKLDAYAERASKDGRARENLMYHGASTGRWSGRGIQLQNLPRPDLSSEELDQCFDLLPRRSPDCYRMLYGSVLPVVSSMLRGFVIAPDGKLLIRADFANIEGRMLAWLAGEKWKLDAFRAFDTGTGDDLYKITAGGILGKPPKAVTKDERQAYGKVPELALGFQGGVGAFQSMAKLYRVNVTDDQADSIKLAWRDRHPAIVQFWYALEEAAMQAVANPGRTWKVNACAFASKNNVLWARLPSGRLLAYVDPQIKDIETPWGETKAAVTFMGQDQITRQWSRQKAYGGFWSQQFTQASARDILASAMLRLEANRYNVVLTVHDEIVCETTPDRADVKEFERLMCVLPEWATGLPVTAEGAVGSRYGK